MIKHIVLWKLKDEANGRSKQQNACLIKEKLEALNGRIPGLINLEVGLHIADSESSVDDADVVLYSEFEDLHALENYYVHPEHASLKPMVKSVRAGRSIINYII